VVKCYILFPGIDGKSTDGAHARWMDIESFSQAESGAGAKGGVHGGRDKEQVTLTEYNFTKKMDKASGDLMRAVAKGTPFPKVTLEVARQLPGGWQHIVLEYVFEGVMISSYSTAGSSRGEATPSESFSLNFKKMTYNYS